jgi:hypothetical protein
MAAFRGKIAPSIGGSRTDERAQLTRRNSIRTRLDRSYSISLVGRVTKLCLVLVILVVIAGDAPRAPIRLRTLLRCRQVAQLNDRMINALCFTGIMPR